MTRYLLDRDGDVWLQNEDGDMTWDAGGAAGERDAIERRYGPLTVLVPAEGMIPAAEVEALAADLARFSILNDPTPSHIDVPDDYEYGIHEAADRLRALVARHTTEPTPEED